MHDLRVFAPLAAVEYAASGFFACADHDLMNVPAFTARMSWHQHRSSTFDFGPLSKTVSSARRPFAPLFEKERYARGLALVAELAGPVRVHRPRAWTRLAAD